MNKELIMEELEETNYAMNVLWNLIKPYLVSKEKIDEIQESIFERNRRCSKALSPHNEIEEKWIPVTERLPETGVPVLVFDGKPFPYSNTLTPCKRWIFGSDIKITHWQPLPEPPKGEK